MKQIIICVIALISAIAWLSCSESQPGPNAGATKESGPASAGSATESSGSTVFSATIDGQPYSSAVSNGDQNTAINQTSDNNEPYLAFFLSNLNSQEAPGLTRSFHVVVAKQARSIHLTSAEDIPNYDIELNYLDGDLCPYRIRDIQLHITALTDKNIKGDFNGSMYLVDSTQRKGKRSIAVDVKFDIPVAPPLVAPA